MKRPSSPLVPALGPATRHFRRWTTAWALALPLVAAAQGLPQPGSRGQLLYGNHCIACHTTQMHWRDKKLVTDWPSLKVQVRRWQGTAQLNWSEEDIDDVARFLNDTYYRLQGARVAVLPSAR
jgi:mono/diheme cytochrome c family protein